MYILRRLIKLRTMSIITSIVISALVYSLNKDCVVSAGNGNILNGSVLEAIEDQLYTFTIGLSFPLDEFLLQQTFSQESESNYFIVTTKSNSCIIGSLGDITACIPELCSSSEDGRMLNISLHMSNSCHRSQWTRVDTLGKTISYTAELLVIDMEDKENSVEKNNFRDVNLLLMFLAVVTLFACTTCICYKKIRERRQKNRQMSESQQHHEYEEIPDLPAMRSKESYTQKARERQTFY